MQTRHYFLLAFLFLSSSSLFAQGWVNHTTFPGGARERMYGFATDSSFYMGGGRVEDFGFLRGYNDFWEYTPSTNAWRQRASLPGGERWSNSGMTINGRGYTGGGWRNGNWATDWYEYDPGTNFWRIKKKFPGQGRAWAVAESVNGKGYYGLGGVINFSYYDDWWEYDPVTNDWTALAPFPAGPRTGCAAFVVGNTIYVGMGENGINQYSDLWAYDIATDSWSQKSAYPGGGKLDPFAESANGYGYVCSGYNSPFQTNIDMYAYNPVTDTWIQQPVFLGDRRIHGLEFSVRGKLYFGMGRDYEHLNDGHHDDIWEFTPTLVGREEAGEALTIEVWPTIFLNELHLRGPGTREQLTVSFFHINGQQMMEQTLSAGTTTLSTDRWAPGVYIVEVKQGGHAMRKKVIKH